MAGETPRQLTLAAPGIRAQCPSDSTPNITTLSHVSLLEAEILHQPVDKSRNVRAGVVSIQRRPCREGIPWERRNDEMVGKRLRSVLLLKQVQQRQEFQEAPYLHQYPTRHAPSTGYTWPPMQQHNRHGILLLREQRHKMHSGVINSRNKLRTDICAGFAGSPTQVNASAQYTPNIKNTNQSP